MRNDFAIPEEYREEMDDSLFPEAYDELADDSLDTLDVWNMHTIHVDDNFGIDEVDEPQKFLGTYL